MRMKRPLVVLLMVTALLATAIPATAQPYERGALFHNIATFYVPDEGIAEIVSATPNGQELVYSNATAGLIGIVDISDPANPTQTSAIEVNGEPTSVTVTPDGQYALAVVKTSVLGEGEEPLITPGELVQIALPEGEIVGTLEIGNGPDSIALASSNDTLAAVIAIENEPIIVDEDGSQTDGDAPGDPNDISGPGYVQIIELNLGDIAASEVHDVTFDEAQLAALGLFFPDDPQPEFVSVKGGKVAVTLQENNGVAIIDLATAGIDTIFSSGIVADRRADLITDEQILFVQTYPADVSDVEYAGARMSDAIAWSADGSTLYTADEGELDYSGGRGWSAWTPNGDLLWTDGGSMESIAIMYGQYPDSRSDAKGVEMEGTTTGVFGNTEYVFVGSERGSFVAVYDISTPYAPEFVQFFPTGISPEGMLALPQRNLFVTSEEVSGTITIFEFDPWAGVVAPENRPLLNSGGADQPWAALSGMAAGHSLKQLYAVPDNALPSSIFHIDVNSFNQGVVTQQAPVTKAGQQMRYDLEGIANDTSIAAPGGRLTDGAGWWLASEGNAAYDSDAYQPNVLIQINMLGEVLNEIYLPSEVDSPEGGWIRSNGYEGVAVSPDGRYLLAAIQREYTDDVAVDGVLYTRIARYDLETGAWDFFLYPLDPATVEDSWIGLSEIITLSDGRYAVIERDNQLGRLASIKKVYAFTLDGVETFDGLVEADSDLSGHVIEKTELYDVLNDFKPFEKVEGLAQTYDGSLWAALDNDGGELANIVVNLGVVGPVDEEEPEEETPEE